MSIWEEKLLLLLQAKRSEDPDGFREYLPEVEQLLRDLVKAPPKVNHTYGPKGWQQSIYESPWWEAVRKMDQGVITAEEATEGLECCANLLLDNAFTDSVSREAVERLFLKVTDRAPDSYQSETTISLYKGGPVEHSLSAIRGMFLQLDGDRRLVSVTIDPVKVAEGRSMLEMIKPRPG